MDITTRLALQKPIVGDAATAFRLAITHNADAADAAMVGFEEGLEADLPAPGVSGWYYWATDTTTLRYDDGTTWQVIYTKPSQFNARGLLSARPDPDDVLAGFEYFATDDKGGAKSRSTGAAWERVARALGLRVAKIALNFASGSAQSFTTTQDGTYLFLMQSTAIINVSAGPTLTGLIARVNGTDRGLVEVYRDNSHFGKHETYPLIAFSLALAAGTHNLNFANGGFTQLDGNDRASAVVLELD